MKYIYLVVLFFLSGCKINNNDNDVFDPENQSFIDIKQTRNFYKSEMIQNDEKLVMFEYDLLKDSLTIEKTKRNENDSIDIVTLSVSINGIVRTYIDTDEGKTITSVQYSPTFYLSFANELENPFDELPSPE